MIRFFRTSLFGLSVVLGDAAASAAQPTATEPPPAWTADVSAGLSLTSGNTNTSTINFSYGLAIHP